ncbi:hypothetical protein C8R46DRAFT_1029521 [Mycena filopes]|nr:hypothetical protein C8R46DRAFT_1029521 [Mycena filopes]
MPLLCFAWFATRSTRDDASIVVDFDVLETSSTAPRRHAEEPPHLGTTTTNLFDTFPRVGFGGYRRYYESRSRMKAPVVAVAVTTNAQASAMERSPTSFSFQPSLSSIEEDYHEWGWQALPKFTGRKPRSKLSSRRSGSLRSNNTCPHLQLRKKPRFRASARPLVDTTYAWPDWLAVPYSPREAKTFGEKDDSDAERSSSDSSSSAAS